LSHDGKLPYQANTDITTRRMASRGKINRQKSNPTSEQSHKSHQSKSKSFQNDNSQKSRFPPIDHRKNLEFTPNTHDLKGQKSNGSFKGSFLRSNSRRRDSEGSRIKIRKANLEKPSPSRSRSDQKSQFRDQNEMPLDFDKSQIGHIEHNFDQNSPSRSDRRPDFSGSEIKIRHADPADFSPSRADHIRRRRDSNDAVF